MTVPTNSSAANPLFEEEGKLQRALGLPSLVLFGLVYMVPLTVFTPYGIVTETTGGRLPVAYIVTLIAMVFTAVSYARMAVAYPVAGSSYTYAQKSFGAPIGFLAGWSLLLDYLFLPMINYLVIGIYLAAAIPAVPTWVFIVVAIAIVTVLNIVGIVSVARANFLIIAVQTIFIVTSPASIPPPNQRDPSAFLVKTVNRGGPGSSWSNKTSGPSTPPRVTRTKFPSFPGPRDQAPYDTVSSFPSPSTSAVKPMPT